MKRFRWLITPLALMIICLLLVLVSAGETQALMLKLSVDDLTANADSVVIGKVVERSSHWNAERTMIYTTVVVSVEERLKDQGGKAGQDRISLTVPGGEVDGIRLYVSDMVSFLPGDKAVVFLKQLSEAKVAEMRFQGAQISGTQFEVCGKSQGKMAINGGKVGNVALTDFKAQVAGAIQRQSSQDKGGGQLKGFIPDDIFQSREAAGVLDGITYKA